MSGGIGSKGNPPPDDLAPVLGTRGRAERWFWGLYAICYDALTRLHSYRAMHQRVVARLDPQPGQDILDAGCGTGNLIAALLAVEPRARVLGLDFSPSMLRLTRRKAGGAEVGLHDLNQRLPFESRSFHAVVCTNALYTLTDPVAVLGEFRRVLRPGGKIVVINPLPDFGPLSILSDHLKNSRTLASWIEILAYLPHILTILALNLVIRSRGAKGSYHFADRDRFRVWALAADLEVVEAEVVYAGQGLLLELSPPIAG